MDNKERDAEREDEEAAALEQQQQEPRQEEEEEVEEQDNGDEEIGDSSVVGGQKKAEDVDREEIEDKAVKVENEEEKARAAGCVLKRDKATPLDFELALSDVPENAAGSGSGYMSGEG